MKRLCLVLLATLAACADTPSTTAPRPGGGSATLLADTRELGSYRRVPNVLTVYDRRPELGIASLPGQFSHVTGAGMRLVRGAAYFGHPDTHGNLRSLVTQAAAHGIELVVAAVGPKCRSHADGDPYDAYVRWVVELADSFPEVRYWELGNEQDAAPVTNLFGAAGPAECGTEGTATVFQQGVSYAENILQHAYPAIKAANPDAWVLIGGLVGEADLDFLRGIYAAGGRAWYDFLSVHAYGDSPAAVLAFPGRIDAVLNDHGDPGRPVWLTEFGAGAVNYPGADPPIPHLQDSLLNDSVAYDHHQKEWWRETLDFAEAQRRYAKLIGYHLYTSDDSFWPPAGANVGNPANFGANLLRYPSQAPRPAYQHLVDRGFNAAVLAQPARNFALDLDLEGMVPSNYPYTRLAGGRVRVHGVTVSRFWPAELHLVPDPAGGENGGR